MITKKLDYMVSLMFKVEGKTEPGSEIKNKLHLPIAVAC